LALHLIKKYLQNKKTALPMEDFRKGDQQEIFSKKIRAGKRTYFFDVKSTKGNDYFITITESKKRFDDGSFVKHKIFLYKEDFNKFMEALNETVNHVKTELMPEYNFDEFNRDNYERSEFTDEN
jgi:hypothetical protein